MHVVILGSHPANSPSMLRYTSLLAAAYQRLGHQVTLMQPGDGLSRRISSPRAKKMAAYFEQLIAFPLTAFRVRSQADLTHIADHSDSPWLFSAPKSWPTLVTCHDLFGVRASLGEIPEHKPKLPGRTYQSVIRRGLRRATWIVAVSDTTLGDIYRLFPQVDASRIYNPIAGTLSAQAVNPSGGGQSALIVGSTGWRKRRDISLQVWLEIRRTSVFPSIKLEIVGPPLTDSELELLNRAQVPITEVVVHNDISDEELSYLYANASFLIQMSKYEGFCWPILEANRHGVLAVCADEPILRETGEGNVFIRPDFNDTNWTVIAETLSSSSAKENVLRRTSQFDEPTFDRALRTLHSDLKLTAKRNKDLQVDSLEEAMD